MSSPDELAQLQASNASRLAAINAAGMRVNGINEHWLYALLEEVVIATAGTERMQELRLAHERWLQPQLDQAEALLAQHRREQLKAPATALRSLRG